VSISFFVDDDYMVSHLGLWLFLWVDKIMSKIRSQQIRARGTPKKALLGGRVKLVPMPDGLYYDKTRDLYIQCIDMDNHYIGMNPDFLAGREAWVALCSCGGPAVITGYNAYAHGASPSGRAEVKEIAKGEMLVCHMHLSTGYHGDGSS